MDGIFLTSVRAIATRKYIPEHICAQWDPDVIIIDIDSDDDEAGEDRDDEPDSDAPKTGWWI